MPARIRVLFICLGNICRSPVAEGLLLDRLRRHGLDAHFEVSSAGLGAWHAGELPDERARRVAAAHGVALPSRARRVDPEEFERTQWIVCMDESNRAGLARIGAPAERVHLLKSFAPAPIGATAEVDDPYQHGPEAFDRMFAEMSQAMEHFIDRLVATHGLPTTRPSAPRSATGDRTAPGRGGSSERSHGV